MEDQIIKKEERLRYLNGGFGTKGELILTIRELSFVHKGKKLLLIPLKEILSTQALRVRSFNGLVISYNNNGKESKASITHFGIIDLLVLRDASHLLQLREPYFNSWVRAIDNARLGRHAISSNSNSQIGVADELKKLKELIDRGIITQFHFDNQKKKLLE